MDSQLPEGEGYKPNLPSLRKMFEEASDLTKTARLESRKDGDYYHGYQWTKEERDALQRRKQPDSVFNRIRPAVNGTLGVLQQGATDPRAYPRNPGDEDAADVASKVLRYVADDNQFDNLKIRVARDYLIGGTGAAIVEVDGEMKVKITDINAEEFFADPRSRREDFADARYLGVAKWQYADDVAARYPESAKGIEDALEGSIGAVDDTFEDRPTDASNTVAWTDRKKRRVMVVEIYHREGDRWFRCVFHSGGVLEAGESGYLNERGVPSCPIEAQSCFVDRENNRYGIVRDMRGPQDEINKRRSKLLHLLNASQIQAVDPSAVEVDSNTARAEAAKPDGVIPFGWQKVPTSDVAAGQAQLLAEAKAEIERMGPNPAILGRQGESSSGRAQLVRQQAGLTEQAVIYAGVEAWELRIYRQIWARVRQFWTAPMFIRVTDDEGAPEFIGVNQVEQGFDEMGFPVQSMQNQLGQMDVDIMLDSVPDTANVQQEQFETLVELARMYGPQEVPFDDLLMLSAMPGKREVMDKRKGRAEQAGQAQQQMQQMQAQLAQAGMQADIENKQADTALKAAKAETTVFDSHVKATKAVMSSMSAPDYGTTNAPGIPFGVA